VKKNFYSDNVAGASPEILEALVAANADDAAPFSKMRFVSVQLEAYLRDGLWLRNARHANAMAARLRTGLERIPGARSSHPTEVNLVLVSLPRPVWDGLAAEGYSFSRRGAPGEGIVRIACAFDTPLEAVDALLEAAYRHAGLPPERPDDRRERRPVSATR
jgi:threonine aldolase